MIRPASRPEDIQTIHALLVEYAESLGFSLCFQGFSDELASLPGAYVPPTGALLLAEDATGGAIGCVALRAATNAGVGEMKRLYVRPAARGTGTGRALVTRLIALAREAGYQRLQLDTLPTMHAAIALYEQLGFVDIAPPRSTPMDGVRYLELVLDPTPQGV
jgi:N-acetylglutamate synthase-like GNAT family acetyltransferase